MPIIQVEVARADARARAGAARDGVGRRDEGVRPVVEVEERGLCPLQQAPACRIATAHWSASSTTSWPRAAHAPRRGHRRHVPRPRPRGRTPSSRRPTPSRSRGPMPIAKGYVPWSRSRNVAAPLQEHVAARGQLVVEEADRVGDHRGDPRRVLGEVGVGDLRRRHREPVVDAREHAVLLLEHDVELLAEDLLVQDLLDEKIFRQKLDVAPRRRTACSRASTTGSRCRRRRSPTPTSPSTRRGLPRSSPTCSASSTTSWPRAATWS